MWNKLIRNTKASSVFVVAHSYGGIVTAHLADKAEDFTDRVKAVALTDSVHSLVDMDAFKNVRVNLTTCVPSRNVLLFNHFFCE